MTMQGHGGPEGEPADADAEELINELLDAGFTYEGNGRVSGLAAHGDDLGGNQGGDDPGAGDVPGDDVGGDGGAGDLDAGGDGEGGTEGGAPDLEPPSVGDDGEHGDGGTGSDAGGAGASTPPTSYELPGNVKLNPQEALALRNIRQVLIDNPDIAGRFGEMVDERLTGRAAAGRTGEGEPGTQEGESKPPSLPDFIDPDDPTAVGIWSSVVELQQRHEADLRAQESREAATTRQQVAQDIAGGVARFRSAHPDLTDDDIAAIRDYTSVNVNIAGVMANFPDDHHEGIARALEIGSLTDPAMRDKVLADPEAKQAKREKEDASRKQRLGALSGSTGSGARRPAAPARARNWNEVSQQLAKELEALGGSS